MAKRPEKQSDIPLIGMLAVKNRLITKSELLAGVNHCQGAKDIDHALEAYFIAEALISKKNIHRLAVAAKAITIRQKELRFGAIAIAKGYINKSVLELALEDQKADLKQGRKPRLIGDMMVEAGLLTAKQRDFILKMQKRGCTQVADEGRILPDIPLPAETKEGNRGAGKAPCSVVSPSNTQDGPSLLQQTCISGGVMLQVAADFMSAFLIKGSDFDDSVSVSDIKTDLLDRGIVTGVADDQMIQGFIQSSGFKTKSFKVAKGIYPHEGQDAKVVYFFSTDYLKAGGMDENGTIDFRQRGEIPLVEKGTVLAEKTPRVKPRSGLNIYGEKISMPPVTDRALRYGKGAVLSEDKCKILAAVRGYPKFSLGGVIFVHEEYVTGSDVDFQTGHVEFDGRVNVQGCIKSGFKVRGSDIKAIEIDGGMVEADGDLRVAGGINEGKIYARGNVYAKFILSSEILCMGDVYVEKEIVDCTIHAGGACSIFQGKLIASNVSAKRGLMARNIGTEMGGPSVITVGEDGFLAKELALNSEKIAAVKEERATLEGKKSNAISQKNELNEQIPGLAHIQDRSQLAQAEIRKQLKSSMGKSEKEQLTHKLSELERAAAQAEKNIDQCFSKIDTFDTLINTIDQKLERLDDTLETLNQERINVTQWSHDTPGSPRVVVEGGLLSGSKIIGPNSKMTVNTTLTHVQIFETLSGNTDAQGGPVYQMKIGNYRG
ncbi:MAG: polymerase [Desulfobacterales bacterium]|nr:MAG: polymerase [Desulfobacterales bacterium]